MEVINPHRFPVSAPPAVDFDGFGNASRYFDGVSDYIDLGDSDDFSFGDGVNDSAFSVCAWVKAVDISTFRILTKEGGFGFREWQFTTDGVGRLSFFVADNSSNTLRGRKYSSPLSTNIWYAVSMTYDGRGGDSPQDGISLYVNGSRVDDTDYTEVNTYVAMHNTTQAMEIGRIGFNNTYTDGNIADVRLYNSELSSTDIAAIYGGENITTNLIGHWLKDTPSLLDHSGTNDGTNNGSAFAYDNPSPAVEFGKASRSFDGVSDYVDLGDALDNVFAGTGKKFTITAWIKTTTLADTHPITKYSTSGERAFLIRVLSGGNLGVVMSTDGSFNNRWGRRTDNAPISANAWHHISITYDQTATGDYLRMWVNGTEVATLVDWLSGGTFTSIYDATSELRISGTTENNGIWDGNIADVRIYDTDLSSTDIAAIYGGENITTNLVGHWLTNTDDVKDYAGVNDGTNNGSTYSFDNPLGDGGQYGSASRSFDGVNDSISVNPNASINNVFDGGGTFAAWVKVASDGGSNTGRIMDKRDNSSGWFVLTLNESGGECDIRFNVDFSTVNYRIITTNSITLNAWHHIAVAYNSDSTSNVATVYIDGASVAVTQELTPSGTRVSDEAEPLILGNRDSLGREFDGKICDCRIYDTALTGTDIFNLSRGYDFRTNLVGQWLTNKDDVDDYAGTNHGTNNGSTYSQDAPL